MKLLHDFEDGSAFRGGFVSIGNFDGVHRGHQSMIAALLRRARAERPPSGRCPPTVVFTFDPHPIALLRPKHTPPSLSTLQRKRELLEQCGVDCTIAYPTDYALLNLSPEEFFEQIILGRLEARGLVEGPNFRFGHNRAGDVETLRALCEQANVSLEIVPPVKVGPRLVSSSEIRSLISAGNIAEAVLLLGHPYQVNGHVVRGADRGRRIGFPTANLEGIQTLLPPDGVYAGIAHHEGHQHAAAIHLGPNPTFGEEARKLEVHLIDFRGDLYDRSLAVDFLDRVRQTRAFSDSDQLRAQLAQDVRDCRTLAKQAGRS